MSMLELNSWTFSEEQDFVFVAVRGEDAENFLQGMLTQNVKTMGPTDARRLLATTKDVPPLPL